MSYDPLTERCPTCYSLAGSRCIEKGVPMIGVYHPGRVDLAYFSMEDSVPMPPEMIEKALEGLV